MSKSKSSKPLAIESISQQLDPSIRQMSLDNKTWQRTCEQQHTVEWPLQL